MKNIYLINLSSMVENATCLLCLAEGVRFGAEVVYILQYHRLPTTFLRFRESCVVAVINCFSIRLGFYAIFFRPTPTLKVSQAEVIDT